MTAATWLSLAEIAATLTAAERAAALLPLERLPAFATIAGMPPEYGLYAAMVPAIIAALWGSSWQLVSGPTTAISIVVFEHEGADPWAVLTGDALFIGDVGRPDLLASVGVTADELGRAAGLLLEAQADPSCVKPGALAWSRFQAGASVGTSERPSIASGAQGTRSSSQPARASQVLAELDAVEAAPPPAELARLLGVGSRSEPDLEAAS